MIGIVEQHMIQELVMEQMQAGLPQDLIRHLDACGPITIPEHTGNSSKEEAGDLFQVWETRTLC